MDTETASTDQPGPTLDLTEAVARAIFDAEAARAGEPSAVREEAWSEPPHGWRQIYFAQAEAAIAVVRERIAADIEGRCIGEAVWDEATRNAARIIRGGVS